MIMVIMMRRMNDDVNVCSVCSAQTLAHKPALRRPDPQKYTYSYHGNKCLKGNARSVT